MPSNNPPILLALMLCDTIIREGGSHKYSLIGTFNSIFGRSFPCIHPSFSVYLALTDGRGQVPCVLRMVDLDSGKELFSLKGTVDFKDPTGVAEIPFQIHQVQFPTPGDYALEFYADGNLLGTRKLRVQKAQVSG